MPKEQFLELYSRARAGDQSARAEIEAMLAAASPGKTDYSIWIHEYDQAHPLLTSLPDMGYDELVPEPPPVPEPVSVIDTSAIEERNMRQQPGFFTLFEQEKIAGRKRAYRSNMLRRLRKHFGYMKPFTAQDAALALKRDQVEIAEYLSSEASLPSSQIGYNYEIRRYFIQSPL